MKTKRAQLTAIVAEQDGRFITSRFQICGKQRNPEGVVEFTTLSELRDKAIAFARENLDATLATDHRTTDPDSKRGVQISLRCLEARKPAGWKQMAPIYYWPHENPDTITLPAATSSGIPAHILGLLDTTPPATPSPAPTGRPLLSLLPPPAPEPAPVPVPPAKPLTIAQRIALGLGSVERLAKAGFLGGPQVTTVRDLICKSEERDFFIDKMAEIEATITAMPATYEGRDESIAHLHYFTGSSDWWIVEKDSNAADDEENGVPPQSQAYGFVCLNGDTMNAETGYISLPELLRTGMVELDFHFPPTPLAAIRAKLHGDPEPTPPAADTPPANRMGSTAPDTPVEGQLHIRLTRAEGPSDECYTIYLCSYDDATVALRHWGQTAPDNGCYDKCDVTVTFPDSEGYSYRYDLTRDGSDCGDGCDFRTNLRNRLAYYGNRQRPAHMSAERYEEMKRVHLAQHPDNVAACARLLDTHLAEETHPDETTPPAPDPEPDNVIPITTPPDVLGLITDRSESLATPPDLTGFFSDGRNGKIPTPAETQRTGDALADRSGWSQFARDHAEGNDSLKAGSILVCSWGYDQTNINFFQVTRCSKSSVWFIPLPNHTIPGSEGDMTEYVVPDAPHGTPDPVMRRINSSRDGCKLNEYKFVYLWDGKHRYQSHYA